MAYRATLRRMVKRINERIKKELKTALPFIIAERNAELGMRTDSFSDRVAQFIITMNGLAEEETQEALRRLPKIVAKLKSYSIVQQNLQAKELIGVDIFANNSALQALTDSWIKQNTKLIQSIPEQYMSRVEQTLSTGLRNGQSSKVIGRQIAKDTGITERRAVMIARDQIGTLNGSINQAQLKEAGFDEYEWSSSQDERTRDSHLVMHGLIGRWDDPTVYREQNSKEWRSRATIGAELLHPGGAINCRCVAIAVLDDE